MRRHYDREIYFMVGEEPIIGSPFSPNPPTDVVINEKRAFKFGRMFKDLKASKKPEAEQHEDIDALVKLGEAMNLKDENVEDQNNSDIPSGYTYLGQFIAHEIMFGQAELPTQVLDDLGVMERERTPTIDLDTLYGSGPQDEQDKKFYKIDGARLKVGLNKLLSGFPGPFLNDLPRVGEHPDREALIPDPRNDDNLALAQMHVALIHFHNKVVDKIQKPGLTGHELFKKARESVIKHFQWIVLNDFLPRIIEQRWLDEAVKSASNIFNDERGVFMPVEFSGAAFRIGHSMVRNSYEWNSMHRASIRHLFGFTNFSGDMGLSLTGVKSQNLPNDWIIDWRRFFEFDGIFEFPKEKRNYTKKIDTVFNFNLGAIAGYPHKVDERYRPITVLNLVRGYYLGLPSGQEVAERIKAKNPIPETALHADALRNGGFHKRTPLWYYILKEAELKEAELKGGSRLGDVGSFIVAQTFAGILINSDISILREKDWVPDLPGEKPGHFTMVDLLKFADVVDPIGKLNCLIDSIKYPCPAAS